MSAIKLAWGHKTYQGIKNITGQFRKTTHSEKRFSGTG